MSKALVIKGADFSTNAVTTISFGSVPCEGISFAQNTYTLTSMDSVAVEYTLTPENTTDTVTWSSSDTNVVSVSGGTMTVNGIGTATITATCGEYSASATVSVSIAYIANWKFGYVTYPSGKTYATFAPHYQRITATGTGTQAADTTIVNISTSDYPNPILIPNGTTSIRVSRGSEAASYFYNSSSCKFTWLNSAACGDSDYPNAATYVSMSDTYNLRSEETVTLSVPDGADCFAFHVRTTATYSESDDPNTLADTFGLTIEFLTE